MNRSLIFLLLFFITFSGFSQEIHFQIPDSLENRSFEELKKEIYKNISQSDVAEVYVQTYLQKGKNQKDTLNIANAFYLISYINNGNLKQLAYLDSVINISKNLKNDKFPARAFLTKGVILQEQFNNKEALSNFIKALDFAKANNKELTLAVKQNIGILKSDIGNNQEALEIFRECYRYSIDNNYANNSKQTFLTILFSMADSYQRNQKLDSATIFNNLGYRAALESANIDMANYFTFSEGVTQFLSKNFKAANDSIGKSLPHLIEINDIANIGMSYYYLGASNYATGKTNLGLGFLRKMDSVFQKTLIVLPEQREGYKLLIEHYKFRNNLKNELIYINKMLLVDSILHQNYKEISEELNIQYERPRLLKEKNEIINSLDKIKNELSKKLFLVISIAILVSLIAMYLFVRHRNQKKKHDALMKMNRENTNKRITIPRTIENISKKNVLSIINNLNKFEKNLHFLNRDISLQKVANSFSTNTSYLSKVVNYYKNQNFNTYINELRIDYALKIIPNNKKLQNYTIKALAEEFGYNNAESFSKAFFNKTEIYPSFFIKQLRKKI